MSASDLTLMIQILKTTLKFWFTFSPSQNKVTPSQRISFPVHRPCLTRATPCILCAKRLTVIGREGGVGLYSSTSPQVRGDNTEIVYLHDRLISEAPPTRPTRMDASSLWMSINGTNTAGYPTVPTTATSNSTLFDNATAPNFYPPQGGYHPYMSAHHQNMVAQYTSLFIFLIFNLLLIHTTVGFLFAIVTVSPLSLPQMTNLSLLQLIDTHLWGAFHPYMAANRIRSHFTRYCLSRSRKLS